MYDFAVIGGGIVGLSTARSLLQQFPDNRVLLLEKEAQWAQHPTGRNSGVIHSGIYYQPGSLQATFARNGNRSMVDFCRQHGIRHDVCGKIIVATEPHELPMLERLYRRGLANGMGVTRIGPEQAKEIEPPVNCLGGILVPTTGIVCYPSVCEALAEELRVRGAIPTLNTKVLKLEERFSSVVLETNQGSFESRIVINCAGLHSDRLARFDSNESARIVPFRGEYFELKSERRYLVKNLIYPVPNPQFPFLGVHFIRMIDGSVHAGPKAVLSLSREGYRKTSFNLGDLFETLSLPGFWHLAAKYWKYGLKEMHRSFSKAAFVHSLQRLIPEIQESDLVPSQAGVRAQALHSNGVLVEDFLIVRGNRTVHVYNAPSLAATASLEIGVRIAEQVADILSNKARQLSENVANRAPTLWANPYFSVEPKSQVQQDAIGREGTPVEVGATRPRHHSLISKLSPEG